MQETVVGEACADLRHQLDISYPVNNGIVQNWDDMNHVWDHAFYKELKVNVHDLLITKEFWLEKLLLFFLLRGL